MSREIKFRIWIESSKSLLYDPQILRRASFHNDTVDLENKLTTTRRSWHLNDLLILNKGQVLEQYTGLVDRNGKEIYEGDVVAVTDTENKVVTWNKEEACWGFIHDLGQGKKETSSWAHQWIETMEIPVKEWEVVGNIHEHGELLK